MSVTVPQSDPPLVNLLRHSRSSSRSGSSLPRAGRVTMASSNNERAADNTRSGERSILLRALRGALKKYAGTQSTTDRARKTGIGFKRSSEAQHRVACPICLQGAYREVPTARLISCTCTAWYWRSSITTTAFCKHRFLAGQEEVGGRKATLSRGSVLCYGLWWYERSGYAPICQACQTFLT